MHGGKIYLKFFHKARIGFLRFLAAIWENPSAQNFKNTDDVVKNRSIPPLHRFSTAATR
jgi:hypothetical protein